MSIHQPHSFLLHYCIPIHDLKFVHVVVRDCDSLLIVLRRQPHKDIIDINGIRIDIDAFKVTVDGKQLDLLYPHT
jgi:hypothetical protein